MAIDALNHLLPVESGCNAAWLLAVWRDEFGTLPIDAGDIMANPRTREAFAAAMPWPIEHLSARIVGRHIRRLMGDAVMKLPTHRALAQRWSLRS